MKGARGLFQVNAEYPDLKFFCFHPWMKLLECDFVDQPICAGRYEINVMPEG
ncbi:hypothetical protein SAMN04487996_111333 [Dyadobacter soli]|uniref:Uncharacterized protein n=1 Tax=Dyadobacter soli TaxID=659014 RepID=A0A1G7MQS9_9BACT|nr:hypothetical protein SAMN04487996_111333 [Dyadobacter soli]